MRKKKNLRTDGKVSSHSNYYLVWPSFVFCVVVYQYAIQIEFRIVSLQLFQREEILDDPKCSTFKWIKVTL